MSAFLPPDLRTALLAAAVVLASLLGAFAVSRLRAIVPARVAGWALVAAAFVGAERLCARAPAGFRMLAICGAVLFAMKGLVAAEDQHARGVRLGARRWFAWGALWPGMRPELFAGPRAPDVAGGRRLVLFGARRLLIGVLLVALAGRVGHLPHARILATALALPGLSLALHFGLFNVGAGLWRCVGVPAEPLFRAPLRSTSLTEFWGRRWNLAFTEMTQRVAYRPLVPRVGRGAATVAAFLFSAALHELAISVPVRAGFGLPLGYFALHGALVVLEKALLRRGWDLAQRPALGRAWTLAWLALPMPILFHGPFLRGVVWPLVGGRY